MTKSLRLALCMRSRLTRDGINRLLQSEKLNIIADVKDVSELISSKVKSDLSIFVIYEGYKENESLIDETDIRQIVRVFPKSRIIILVESFRPEQRRLAEQIGVVGVLSQTMSSETFLACLSLIMQGEHVFSSTPTTDMEKADLLVDRSGQEPKPVILGLAFENVDFASRRVSQPHLGLSAAPSSAPAKFPRRGELSQRELEILACLVSGSSNKEIARSCNITEATVKVHLKAILRKTEVANRTQAAVWALNNVDLNGHPAEARRVGAGS